MIASSHLKRGGIAFLLGGGGAEGAGITPWGPSQDTSASCVRGPSTRRESSASKGKLSGKSSCRFDVSEEAEAVLGQEATCGMPLM